MGERGLFARWRRDHRDRRLHCTMDRGPFFDLAARFLPGEPGSLVVDIGAGNGAFLDRCARAGRPLELVPLDANPSSVAGLAGRFPRAALYRAPAPLPFKDGTVRFVHCSHLVEHLVGRDVYALLVEIDRVLAPGGIFAVSAPPLWPEFYDDLSHMRPFAPEVFRHYLCGGPWQRSAPAVSDRYAVAELAYRWTTAPFDRWGSPLAPVDFVLQGTGLLLHRLGIRRYLRNGFTLVLRKS
ncbi:MAG: class I SAM-dependent methyltransferase [Candidatus Krumholzibacteriota bacterium]|nr:class I SAM-dependent methyltransferase [Candidatus Krumholzibacteriota bacterium]